MIIFNGGKKMKMSKEEYKKLFESELHRTMNVIRGSSQKVVEFSKGQGKVWEQLK